MELLSLCNHNVYSNIISREILKEEYCEDWQKTDFIHKLPKYFEHRKGNQLDISF